MVCRTKVVWIVLAFLGLPLSGHAALTWDVMSIDAKVAADDKKVSHAFTFTNVGAAPVAIERVKSSCGCTSAKLGDKHVYAPGESGVIQAEFVFGFRKGRQVKTITVQTDEPGDARFTL